MLCDAWLEVAAPEAQAPLPRLRGAVFETRPPVAEFMPRLRGTALIARVPVAELGPWPMGTAHEARVPFVEIGPGLRGTALATYVPFAGTAPCEYATDGVGARGLEIEAMCAALLDRLAAGARASRETNGGVPYVAAGGRVARDVPPLSC